jgi:hypothetical protein
MSPFLFTVGFTNDLTGFVIMRDAIGLLNQFSFSIKPLSFNHFGRTSTRAKVSDYEKNYTKRPFALLGDANL